MKLRSLPVLLVSLLVSAPAAAGPTYPVPFPTSIGGTGVTQAQGTGPKVQLSTGATTANDCVKFDASGNTVDAGAGCGSGGGSPGGLTGQVQTNNGSGGFAGITNPAALKQISSGMMIDPRNYGAVCDGTLFINGTPTQNGTDDDTAGFVAAEFAAAATGGVVMVPDGCWVQNLPALSGITFVGQNWAPNYGYDYGTGTTGYTLSVIPGSGYTNGTYPLALNFSQTSATSNAIGSGSKTFSIAAYQQIAAGGSVYLYSNSAPSNWMRGSIASYSSGSGAMTVNVTSSGGSGTFTDWRIVPGYGFNVGKTIVSSTASTSTTSVTIGTGTQNFTTGTGVSFAAGNNVEVVEQGNNTNWMAGTVTSYNSTTGALVLSITSANGTGTFTDWNVSKIGSTTSNVIATGALTFTVQSGLSISTGQYLTLASYQNFQNSVFGSVTSYSGTTLTVNVTQTSGSGTVSDWQVYAPSTVTVSGGALASYLVTNGSSGVDPAATISVPAGAGAGTGGAIGLYVRASGQPLAKPVLYGIGAPNTVINVNGAETVSFVGFEVNALSNTNAAGNTSCIGDNLASQGFGGKIWLYQMSTKGCAYGFQASASCFDFLVSENSDYSANNIGIGGCFSDFLSAGDTFTSGTYGIQGSGGGFARVQGDRFEYLTEGIAPGANAFLEWSIVDTQFDHFIGCAIDLGTQWNQMTVTGGALKSGGTGGSLSVTGTAASASSEVQLTVTSAVQSVAAGYSVTTAFRIPTTTLGTSTSSVTVGLGSQTFTTGTALGLTTGSYVQVYETSSNTNSMYGSVTSDTGTTLVINVLEKDSRGSGGTHSDWTFANVPVANVTGVGGTTEANGKNWPVAVTSGTTIALLGSTYVNAWTSGGYAGVRGYDSDICSSGASPGNKSNQLTVSNVGFYSSSSLGQVPAPAYVIETNKSNPADGDYVGFYGSAAVQAGSNANVAINYNAFTMGFENWVNQTPTHYKRDVLGLSKVDTNDANLSETTSGQIGLGTIAPATGLALDATNSSLGAFGFPQWSGSGARPTITGLNGIGFNSSTHLFEAWNGSAWSTLGTQFPSAGQVLVSAGTSANPTGISEVDGDCVVGSGGAWAAGSCVTASTNSYRRSLSVTFDGGGALPTAGKVVYLSNVPYNATLTGWTLLADASCSAVVDVWEVAFASAPPTVANTIAGSDLPTLSGSQKAQDTTLTGWGSTALSTGSTMGFKLNSASGSCTQINLTLQATVN